MYWYAAGPQANFNCVRMRLFLLLALIPTALAAQIPDSIAIRGIVIDAATALPVPRIQVLIVRQRDTVARLTTDSLGIFVASGRMRDRLTAHFRRLGYVPDSLEFDVGEMPVRVAMNSTLAIPGLQAIEVKEKAFNSFERRAGRSAAGTFISLQKIQERKPERTSQLFRGIGGVTVGDSLGIVMVYSGRAAVSRRRMAVPTGPALNPNGTLAGTDAVGNTTNAPAQSDIGNCAMRTRIDGILQPPGSSLDDIRPDDIYGIEVYGSSAAIPAEYQTVQSEAECGLILIWLKRSKERLRK